MAIHDSHVGSFSATSRQRKGNYTNALASTAVRHFATEVNSEPQPLKVDLNLKDMVLYCNEERWHEYPEAVRVDATFIDTHLFLTMHQYRSNNEFAQYLVFMIHLVATRTCSLF